MSPPLGVGVEALCSVIKGQQQPGMTAIRIRTRVAGDGWRMNGRFEKGERETERGEWRLAQGENA